MGENKAVVKIKGSDGKVIAYKRSNIKTMMPPVSPMPPMHMLMKADELRDVVAYLKSLDQPFRKRKKVNRLIDKYEVNISSYH